MPRYLSVHLAALMLFLLSTCSSCVQTRQLPDSTLSGSVSDQIIAITAGSRIPSTMQDEVLHRFANSDHSQLFALFTSAGYSNQGQTAIYIHGESPLIERYAPNRQELTWSTRAPEGSLQKFVKAIEELSSLNDFEKTSFDGVVYEFIHIEKKEGRMQLKQRVFMQGLGLQDTSLQHERLISLFSDITEQNAPI